MIQLSILLSRNPREDLCALRDGRKIVILIPKTLEPLFPSTAESPLLSAVELSKEKIAQKIAQMRAAGEFCFEGSVYDFCI